MPTSTGGMPKHSNLGAGMKSEPAPGEEEPSHGEPQGAAADGAGSPMSLGQKVVHGAKSALGNIGTALHNRAAGFLDVHKAKLRVKHPGLAYALHGAPKQGELGAAQHMGLHHQYARMGHELPGYRSEVHPPAEQDQATTGTKRVRKPKDRPVPNNMHPAFAADFGKK